MTAQTLREAGEALYGARWQSDLARLLDVDDRRVRAWIAGERSIPPGIWPEIAAELRRRGAQSVRLADRISASV